MVTIIFDWFSDRVCEPSSWAAVGVGLIGIGIIFEVSILAPIGVGVAGVAIVIREKGKN